MAYKTERKRTPNRSSRGHYGYKSKPTGITIHHWGGDGQKHDNVVHWLTGGGGNRGSSAHEVISAGRVTILADGDVATWHAGNNRGNGTTIGLECRPEMSAGDWETLVERCTDLEEQWGSLRYYKHSDWKNTACPGRYGSRIQELVDAINAEHSRRKGGKAKPSPKPSPKPKPKRRPFPLPKGHWFGVESRDNRNHSGYWTADRPHIRVLQAALGVAVDGIYGPRTRAAVVAYQKRHGLRVDGGAGAEVWGHLFG